MWKTVKQGGETKANRPSQKRGRSRRQNDLRFKIVSYGRTEKILRRNRPLWKRLHSKEGRNIDKQELISQLND